MKRSTDLITERLWFGTAPIGMPNYGHPTSGSRTDPRSMFEYLYSQGVRKFDTASNYGSAEKLLASFVSQRNDCIVATKIGAEFHPDQVSSLDGMIRELERSLSLFSKIDTVYLHKSTPEVLSNEILFSKLEQYVQSGDVRKLGASVYGEEQLLNASQNDCIEVIQVAGCILDWSLVRLCLSVSDKKVVCRSVFLQGLLFRDRSNSYYLPDSSVFEERFSTVKDLSDRLRINSGQLSFWFMMHVLDNVDIVFGSRSIGSVNENLAILDRVFDLAMFDQVMRYGDRSFGFMNPRLWKRKGMG